MELVVFLDRDLAKIETEIMACGLVMIARDIDHAGAVPRLAEQFLDDIIMFLRPVEAFFQLPAIDDIANEIERLAPCVSKVETGLGTRALVQMCVEIR